MQIQGVRTLPTLIARQIGLSARALLWETNPEMPTVRQRVQRLRQFRLQLCAVASERLHLGVFITRAIYACRALGQ